MNIKEEECDHIYGITYDSQGFKQLSYSRNSLHHEFKYCPMCAKPINKPDGYSGEY